MARHEFHALDGLRGIAALVVVMWHMPPIMQESALTPESGYLAVDLFFCLSGFVLSHAYGWRIGRGLSYKDFFVIRVLRLYPTFILGITLGGLGVAALLLLRLKTGWSSGELIEAVFTEALMLPSLPLHSAALFPLDNPAWSLFLEVLASPILVISFRQKKSWSSTIIAVAIGTFALLTVVLYRGSMNFGSTWNTFFFGFLRMLVSFYSGIAAFRIFGYWNKTIRLTSPFASVLLVFMCSYLLFARPGTALRPWFDIVCATMLFPGIVSLLALTELRGRLLHYSQWSGSWSYPLYMIHVPLLAIMASLIGRIASPEIRPICVLICLFLLAALSLLVANTYDVRARRWIREAFSIGAKG